MNSWTMAGGVVSVWEHPEPRQLLEDDGMVAERHHRRPRPAGRLREELLGLGQLAVHRRRARAGAEAQPAILLAGLGRLDRARRARAPDPSPVAVNPRPRRAPPETPPPLRRSGAPRATTPLPSRARVRTGAPARPRAPARARPAAPGTAHRHLVAFALRGGGGRAQQQAGYLRRRPAAAPPIDDRDRGPSAAAATRRPRPSPRPRWPATSPRRKAMGSSSVTAGPGAGLQAGHGAVGVHAQPARAPRPAPTRRCPGS